MGTGEQLTLMFIYEEFLKAPNSDALLSYLSSNATPSGRFSLTSHPTLLGQEVPLPGVDYMSRDYKDYLIVSFHSKTAWHAA